MHIKKTPIGLDVDILNEIFSNFESIESNKHLKYLEKVDGHMGVSGNSYSEEGVQGEYDEYHKIYQILSKPEILIRITYNTDSYGSNDYIVSIQFGKRVKKTIQTFEKL